MKNATKLCIAILLTIVATMGRAQENPSKPVAAAHFYHLLFQLEEVDGEGKIVNTRAYTTTIYTAENKSASIRSGSRIPVLTNTGKGDVTYLDIGVDIDIQEAVEKEGRAEAANEGRLETAKTGGMLQLHVTATQSSVISTTSNPLDPVIRQNTWRSNVIVPVGKPTVIFSSDNLENKGKMQLELTATRID